MSKQLRAFNNSDWFAYAGVDSSTPQIAELADGDLILDGNAVAYYTLDGGAWSLTLPCEEAAEALARGLLAGDRDPRDVLALDEEPAVAPRPERENDPRTPELRRDHARRAAQSALRRRAAERDRDDWLAGCAEFLLSRPDGPGSICGRFFALPGPVHVELIDHDAVDGDSSGVVGGLRSARVVHALAVTLEMARADGVLDGLLSLLRDLLENEGDS